MMTRCSACNAPGLRLVEPKEAARGRVPERIFDLVPELYDCGGCGKVFWVRLRSGAGRGRQAGGHGLGRAPPARGGCLARVRWRDALRAARPAAPQVGPKSESALQLMESLFAGRGAVATPLRAMGPHV